MGESIALWIHSSWITIRSGRPRSASKYAVVFTAFTLPERLGRRRSAFSAELECAHVRMALRGSVFEDRHRERERQPCCTLRIPLSDDEYVNFKYPAESSMRHAVAISSIVEILQRPLAAREPDVERLAVLHAATRRARPMKATRPLGAASASSLGTRGL
jgi:hypothetical protein